MSLTSVELDQIRFELGYPLTRIGAEPYITFAAVFSRAVAPYLTDVGSTSATAVTASAAGANNTIVVAANPVAVDPYNTVGFVVGANVVVDVGPAQETAIIQVVSGLSLTLSLTNAHGALGIYPVMLAGAEKFIRDLLNRLTVISNELTNTAPKVAGLTKVDEIEASSQGAGKRGGKTLDRGNVLYQQRDLARRDLARALGVGYLNDQRASAGAQMEIY